MKKMFILVLFCVLLFGITGCGNENEDTPNIRGTYSTGCGVSGSEYIVFGLEFDKDTPWEGYTKFALDYGEFYDENGMDEDFLDSEGVITGFKMIATGEYINVEYGDETIINVEVERNVPVDEYGAYTTITENKTYKWFQSEGETYITNSGGQKLNRCNYDIGTN